MAKNHERRKLYEALWNIAEDLRGSVSGWDFKQYVLIMLFYRFISESLADYVNRKERENPGQESFDYASLPDDTAEYGRSSMLSEKGFLLLPVSCLKTSVIGPKTIPISM